MHIAFLTSEFPHKNLNHAAGLGTSIYNMALSFVKKGVKVTIFVYSQKEDTVFDFEGINMHSIKYKKYPLLGWFLYRKHINSYINVIVKKSEISLIEVPDWTGISAFMKFKIPVIMRIHGSDAYFCHLEARKQKKKNFYFENKAIHNVDALLSVSKYAANVTKKLFGVNKKIKVIPNGINFQKFKNNSPLKFTQNTILYYGTLIRKKGVLELASIFNLVVKQMPETKLILIGSDSNDISTGEKSTYKLMLNLFSETVKQKVEYIGKVSYNDLMAHIKDAHICVFPSLAESFGMVTIEAMAMQKPVVNTSYGWAEEIIENHVDGVLEDPKNHKAFSKAIIDLLNNQERAHLIAMNAMNTVKKKFEMEILSQQNIKFYKKIINEKI